MQPRRPASSSDLSTGRTDRSRITGKVLGTPQMEGRVTEAEVIWAWWMRYVRRDVGRRGRSTGRKTA